MLVIKLFRSGAQFRKLLRETSDLENELGSHPFVKNTPINIRDVLYGGRIEAKMWYKVKQGEEIHYADIISLPFICKKGKFLIGHLRGYVGADFTHRLLDKKRDHKM